MEEPARTVGEIILAGGDTPERRALANAYALDMLDLKALIVNRFDRVDASGKQRDEQLATIDKDVNLTLDRMHQVAGIVQHWMIAIQDQALYASLIDERLTIVETEVGTIRTDVDGIKADLVVIKEKLGL